jgi:hypothetical protein
VWWWFFISQNKNSGSVVMNKALLKKLSRLSFHEAAYRVKELIGSRLEVIGNNLGIQDDPEQDLLTTSCDPKEVYFENPWLNSKDMEDLVSWLSRQEGGFSQDIRRAADQLCQQKFQFFGQSFQYSGSIDWGADPVSGRPWPMKFYSQVDIFGGDTGAGDVKFVWELNRHQFLVTLGKAYCLTGDEQYATKGLEMMTDWITTNPYKMGINWTSGLEIAIRGLSWCWACSLFQESKAFTPEKRRLFLLSLSQHGRWLENHLSFYFSPYNHLIGEATALYVMGSLLPWLKSSPRWCQQGWEIMEKEMPKQFFSDGGTVEQATGYHHFTLGFYLQAFLLRRKLGDPISSDLWSLFEKTFEFSMSLTRPDGYMPMIGDGDEGKALELYQDAFWDFRPFLAIGASMFQRGDLKKVAGGNHLDIVWLLGKKGWEQLLSLKETTPDWNAKALPDSGYYVMRTGWDPDAHYVNFDCGLLAHGVESNELVSAAHGHADALSFELSAFGKPFLIDPGFYTYNGSVEWHRYFRESSSHSTVVVDGQAQALYRGRLKWSNAPTVNRHAWVHTQPVDFIQGSHDGYERLTQSVMHTRSMVFVKPNYWILQDNLTGQGHHTIEQFFHFAPLRLEQDSSTGGMIAQYETGDGLLLLPLEQHSSKANIHFQGDGPESGWMAYGYEQKVRAPFLRYALQAEMPLMLHTLIMPFKGPVPKLTVQVAVQGPKGGMAHTHIISIMQNGFQDFIVLSSEGGLKEFGNGWSTDACMSCLRLNQREEVISATLVGGTKLIHTRQNLLVFGKHIQFGALSSEKGMTVIEMSESSPVETSCPDPHLIVQSL